MLRHSDYIYTQVYCIYRYVQQHSQDINFISFSEPTKQEIKIMILIVLFTPTVLLLQKGTADRQKSTSSLTQNPTTDVMIH